MYGLIARYEPAFLSEAAYKRYAKAVSAAVRGGRGLDVGCGAGYLTRALYAEGLSVTGADTDRVMLDRAAGASGPRIPYVELDAEKGLDGFKELAFITAATDVVNHMRTLDRFFSGAYRALQKNGRLFFDISSADKLKTVVKDQTFLKSEAQFDRIWHNTYDGDNRRIRMTVTYFIREADGRYRKEEGAGIQYIWEGREIAGALKAAGFANIRVCGPDLSAPPEKDAQRIFFIAEKL
ncbi:MAG: methyltransferase domain-containing protein [Clostridiales bacterium]|jgi:SAM-dependent methyltransferase|nr:methyltransferase domain-containing protein [Clostridiales bacterium]